MTSLTVTHRSTVTEEQIDHLGHMNVRFYGTNAERAMNVLLGGLELPAELHLQLVDVYTRHHREQLSGARLVVRSGVVEASDDGIRLYHELANEDTGTLAATFFHRLASETVMGARRPLPRRFVEEAAAMATSIPAHGATRSISLDVDPSAQAPELADLRDRELAMREARTITADECDSNGVFLRANAPGLMWGGEPVTDARGYGLHAGPNGETMGWASMETRLSIRRLPGAGDQIQSFGAVVDVRDKTSQRIQWAYDVERGDLLATFEIVNLAFDTETRQAMSIPASIRALEEAGMHRDLTSDRIS